MSSFDACSHTSDENENKISNRKVGGHARNITFRDVPIC